MHLQSHTGQGSSQRCEKSLGEMFSKLSDLQQHLRLHMEPASFRCEECGLEFAQYDHLLYHISHVHTEMSPAVSQDNSPVLNDSGEVDDSPDSSCHF